MDQNFAQKARLLKEKAIADGVPPAAIDRYIAMRHQEYLDQQKNNQVVDVGGRKKLINLTTGQVIADLGPTEAQLQNDIASEEMSFGATDSGMADAGITDTGNFSVQTAPPTATDQIAKFGRKEGIEFNPDGTKDREAQISPSELSGVPKGSLKDLEKRVFGTNKLGMTSTSGMEALKKALSK